MGKQLRLWQAGRQQGSTESLFPPGNNHLGYCLPAGTRSYLNSLSLIPLILPSSLCIKSGGLRCLPTFFALPGTVAGESKISAEFLLAIAAKVDV